jgi:chromosomal replication initiator protein DnaA
VEPWRAAITDAATRWRARGYRTGILDRALASDTPVDAAALLASYEASVQRLDALERDMATVNPGLVGGEWFRDPERMDEAVELVERAFAAAEPPPAPLPQLTRETFEIAPCNQFAAHAADAVVKEPGRRYNPLFIHGPRGVGKSHLAQAVGNELVAAGGGSVRVACLQAETFASELIAALQEGSVERWRSRYRGADVLILEDVQALAGKEQTQEEFFHLFNAYYSAGRQLILTADRAPKSLTSVGDRLRSRFEGGLVVELQAPDAVLCEKLYARTLAAKGCAVSADVLQYLARRRAADVRVILATTERLAAAAAGKPLTLAIAQQVVEGAGAPSAAGVGGAQAGAGAVDAFFLDREKVIWDWPDGAGRLIEEMR